MERRGSAEDSNIVIESRILCQDRKTADREFRRQETDGVYGGILGGREVSWVDKAHRRNKVARDVEKVLKDNRLIGHGRRWKNDFILS